MSSQNTANQDALNFPMNLFYGSLMDEHVLACIVRLRTKSTLVEASMEGFKLMKWGQFPTLAKHDGPRSSVVKGKMWTREDVIQFRKLQWY